jgi:phosphoribosylanthranilate isomerase
MYDPLPIKICGLTRAEDALLAWELGASALGFIFHAKSPRNVSAAQVARIRRELPPEAFCVGVFVDRGAKEMNAIAEEAGLDACQLHGRETPETCAAVMRPVIKAIRAEDEGQLEQYPAAAFLLDAVHPTMAGGTGLKADWNLAARIAQRHRLILAGGLEPSNIREAIETVRPAGLDLSSGVEASPGVKDPAKLRALFSELETQGVRPCLIPR